MLKIHCKKSFRGSIDIRSTYIEIAKKNKVPIMVTCDEFESSSVYMPEELDNPLRIQTSSDGKPFKSKIQGNNIEYTLYVFKWKGDSDIQKSNEEF